MPSDSMAKTKTNLKVNTGRSHGQKTPKAEAGKRPIQFKQGKG